MKKKASEMSVFEVVAAGLHDSIAYSKGEKMSLITSRVPAPLQAKQGLTQASDQRKRDGSVPVLPGHWLSVCG